MYKEMERRRAANGNLLLQDTACQEQDGCDLTVLFGTDVSAELSLIERWVERVGVRFSLGLRVEGGEVRVLDCGKPCRLGPVTHAPDLRGTFAQLSTVCEG